ncbi:TetR/AcrR family transcriptional regulator [Nocardioides sp. SYSU D00038]|uniref:TetR/AcrR family transcriptional regulator n=1 Tax=Nocardioides sp. SYSU D00038 TaxID=2812554 RepID=UPI0019686530|nr:TetR/AcrR family transcriptional regulator [Nocardioides sp. SYSU D00038]
MSSQVSTATTAPRQGLNPKQAETVERLVAAAGDELRAVGVEGLTMRSVATRAGVSAATAYTYFASRNHLFAELFWRLLRRERGHVPAGATPRERIQDLTRHLAGVLEASPEVAAGANLALLGTDPEVERLRLRIGAEFVERFRSAHGEGPGDVLVEALTLVWSGALLQAGMGLTTYAEMADRLDAVVATILEGPA